MEPNEFEKQFSIEDRHFWFVARRRLVRSAVQRATEKRAGTDPLRILELSCATGRNLVEFRDLGPAIGLDLSADALRFCRLRDTPVMRANAERLPIASGSFDLVLALDALEHFDRDDLALGEVQRVLRPGGVAVLTVPALPALWSPHDEAFHHRRRYTRPELRARILSAQLRIERLSYYSTFLLPPLFAFRWLRRVWPADPNPAPRSDFHLEVPGPLDALLDWVYRVEAALLARVDLPLGASLFAVARRPR